MAQLLDDGVRRQVKEILDDMENTVRVLVFESAGTHRNDEYIEITKQLVSELEEITEKVKGEYYEVPSEEAGKYGITEELLPAMVLLTEDGTDLGVRFYGVPAGHEFSTLLQDLVMMSKGGQVHFSEESKARLKTIDKEMRIRVFITLSCPYCPQAVLAAHQTAMINPKVIGEMVEAEEFMELSMEHRVSSVPHTVIEVKEDGQWIKVHEFIGAYPEDMYVEEVLKVV